MLSSMHLSLLDQPAQLPGINNWSYKYFVERYIRIYVHIRTYLLYVHLYILSQCTQATCFLIVYCIKHLRTSKHVHMPIANSHISTRYSSELEVACEENSKQTLKFSEAISCIEDAEEELDSLKKTLEQETEQLEEKKYVRRCITAMLNILSLFTFSIQFLNQACIKLLGKTGRDTAIAGEHEKFLSRLKEQIHHLEKVLWIHLFNTVQLAWYSTQILQYVRTSIC